MRFLPSVYLSLQNFPSDSTGTGTGMAPGLYIDGFGRRIKATELSEYSGGIHWGTDGDEDLARDDVWHEPFENLSTASPQAEALGEGALAVALNLADALDDATLPASESDTTGRIVIFCDTDTGTETDTGKGDGESGSGSGSGKFKGLPSVEVCSEALGLKKTVTRDTGLDTDETLDLRAAASVTAMNWESRIETGFCNDPKEDDLEIDEDDADQAKIVQTTMLMSTELTDHFEFNFTDEVVTAPVLYGGRHGKAIVAVLSMRVWT